MKEYFYVFTVVCVDKEKNFQAVQALASTLHHVDDAGNLEFPEEEVLSNTTIEEMTKTLAVKIDEGIVIPFTLNKDNVESFG